MTTIYLCAYHSEHERGILSQSGGQYRIVEEAIQRGEWPYDNGDDPSFYVARKVKGRLTWGVCRRDVRQSLAPNDIVVFFSYTTIGSPKMIRYRLCAVATVEEKVDHRAVFSDGRLKNYQDKYINTLVRPGPCVGTWRHDEGTRPKQHVHQDWHKRAGVTWRGNNFGEEFSEEDVSIVPMYVVFSDDVKRTFISPNPLHIATATWRESGEQEVWTPEAASARALTIGMVGQKRESLRIKNSSHRNVNRHAKFCLEPEAASQWRARLLTELMSG